MSAYCGLCERYFCNNRALWQHVDAIHFECRCCSEFFSELEEKEEHEESSHYCCSNCNDVFGRQGELQAHMQTEHPRCDHCQRRFVNPRALQNHVDSGVHSFPTTTCKFCKKSFGAVSAMTQHLENGQCPQMRLSRKDVKDFVRSRERSLNMPNSLLRPRIEGAGGVQTLVPQFATSQSWNGWSYECCICNREFNQLSHLNHHLITHEPEDYHCCRCQKGFKLLSAVIQHWEKSGCGPSILNQSRRLLLC